MPFHRRAEKTFSPLLIEKPTPNLEKLKHIQIVTLERYVYVCFFLAGEHILYVSTSIFASNDFCCSKRNMNPALDQSRNYHCIDLNVFRFKFGTDLYPRKR